MSHLRIATAGLALLVPLTALAQAAAEAAQAPSADEPQRVLITAQKRKESTLSVPISVSVFSGEQLGQNQIGTVEDLTRNIPNVSFSSQAGAGLGTVEMRGVSSQAGSATVAVYLDDVSLITRNLYSQGTAEPRFFDLADVQVLRGPQGTLYGASALGGTIKFTSNQPDAHQRSGNVSAELSSTEHGGMNWQVQGVLNLPLVQDKVALRIGLQSGADSGYIDQVDAKTLKPIAQGINGSHWDVAKLALKAELPGGWTVTPALFAQRTVSDDIDASYATVGSYQDTPLAGQPLPIFETTKMLREPGTDRLLVPSVTVNGDVGFADFTGVLSGYERRFNRVQDGTYVNSTYIATQVTDPDLAATVNSLPSAVQLRNTIDQTSLELRLTSKTPASGPGFFSWIGGLYVADAKTQVFDNEPVFGINAAFAAAGQDITNPADLAGAFANDFVGDSSYYSARHYRDKQSSVFGEGTLRPLAGLSLTGGLRFLSASQHFTREGDYYFAGGPTSAVIDSSAHAVTPRVAANYEIDRSTSVFASASKGFRLGGANRPIPLTGAVQQDLHDLGLPGTPPASFAADKLWSYEAGAKYVGPNGLRGSVSVFYIDWRDIQQDVTLPTSGFDFETNVGHATSYGLEAEALWKALPELTLRGSAGLTHAAFAEDVPALGTGSDGLYNVRKGDPIQGVPRASANLGFDWHTMLAEHGVFVRGNGQWTGRSHGTLIRGSTDYERPAYFTADLSTGTSIDRYEFTLFVKNATNTRTVIQQPSIQSVIEQYRLRPRTVGLSVSADLF